MKGVSSHLQVLLLLLVQSTLVQITFEDSWWNGTAQLFEVGLEDSVLYIMPSRRGLRIAAPEHSSNSENALLYRIKAAACCRGHHLAGLGLLVL